MAGKTLEKKMVKQIEIMHNQGLKIKEIARNLSLSKNTVKKYLRKSDSDDTPVENELKPHYLQNKREESDRYRILETFFPEVDAMLTRTGFNLILAWERYKSLHPDGYSRSQFCYYYQKYRSTKNTVMHFEHDYGDKLYIDYAGKKLSYVDLPTGEVIECEFFLTVMGGSQETYGRSTPSQQKADFLECVQDALEYYGGVPKVLVPDNLKSAVSKASRYDPSINSDFMDMANHYNCAVMPARSLKPRDKSLVERHVSIMYTRIYTKLSNQTFFSLSALNEAIAEYMDIHNKTNFQGKDYSRRTLFELYEKQTLSSLPSSRYELKEHAIATVMKNCHVRFGPDSHYYSVPYRYIGEKVKISATCNTVEIFFKGDRIAFHNRSRRPHLYTSCKDHLPSQHQYISDWNPDKFIQWANNIDPTVGNYINNLLSQHLYPEILYRSCSGILHLEKKVGKERLIKACELGEKLQTYNYRFIDRMLRNRTESIDIDNVPEYNEVLHENIRGAEYYKS